MVGSVRREAFDIPVEAVTPAVTEEHRPLLMITEGGVVLVVLVKLLLLIKTTFWTATQGPALTSVITQGLIARAI